MGLYDTVTVELLSAAFQTEQLGEGMLTYRLGEDGRLVAVGGRRAGLPRAAAPTRRGRWRVHGRLHARRAGIARSDPGGSLRSLPDARSRRAVGAAYLVT
jgi:hypothetical protein